MNIEEFIGVGENEKPLDRIVTDGGFCSIFRRIGCIGDSLSSGEFESLKPDGTKEYHDLYDYSWGQYIGRHCGATVYNFSRGGMTAKAILTEGYAERWGLWSVDKLCQAYIIALGVNDLFSKVASVPLGSLEDICLEDYTKNAPTYAGYYAQIIQRTKQAQPRAKFFLVTMPRMEDGSLRNPMHEKARDLLQAMTELFDRTYLIDLYTYAPKYDKEFCDRFMLGHMTATGYVLTARMIESYIDYLIRKYPADFDQVGFIGTNYYYHPEP